MTLRLARRAATTALTLAAVVLAGVMIVPALLGYERYVILTGSMTGTYDTGSIVYAEPVPVADLQRGDVITYAPPAGESPTPLVTHRIASIRLDQDGRRVFRTKGDANASADPWTFTLAAPEQARVTFSVPYAGHAVMALADRESRMALIGGPALLIALLVGLSMVREARAGRRAPAAAEPWVRL
jgi:signal peptidase